MLVRMGEWEWRATHRHKPTNTFLAHNKILYPRHSIGSLPILSLDCSHQSHNMLFLSQQENLCVQPETTENNNFHILGMPGTNHLYNQVGGPDSTRWNHGDKNCRIGAQNRLLCNQRLRLLKFALSLFLIGRMFLREASWKYSAKLVGS